MLILPNSQPWAPPWVLLALADYGVREIKGVQDHPKIVGYHKHTAAGAAPDETAWCASAANAWLERSGLPGTRSKAASSFADYGEESLLRIGCILVFGKADPDAKGTGHVGFGVGWDDTRVLCLGGNQSNEVNVGLRLRKNLVACRWPKGFVWP